MRLFLILKILLFTLLVPGMVTGYLPYRILTTASGGSSAISGWPVWPGMLGLLVGAGIYLRCAWDFAMDGLGTPAPLDPPKTLVVRGLYRHSRNPMYLGVLLVLLSETGLFGQLGLLLYSVIVAVVFQLMVVFYEEPLLRQRFGESYRDYCLRVPRWGPLRPAKLAS